MCRQIFLVGLAMTFLFTGCLLRKDQPVAEQKSFGRALDEAFQGKKGMASLKHYELKVSQLLDTGLKRGLREDEIRELADAVVSGGSKAINNFKKAVFVKIFDEYADTSAEIAQRMADKLNALPPPIKSELNVNFAVPNPDYREIAAFLKTHTDIADDKTFARLVKKQGEHLDDFAEAVATNHRVADAVGAEIANDSGNYGLKRLGLSAEQMTSELKISSDDFFLERILFTTPAKSDPIAGYKFVQELSGVDIGDEAAVLELLLRRGDDGKFAYQKLSAEEIKALGNPFDKLFTKRILITPKSLASDYLQQFYKTN